jgi:hypothetical protein
VAAAGIFKYLRQAFFSNERGERCLYRKIRDLKPAQIVEFGVADGRRSQAMIESAQRYGEEEIRYIGIDMFEARSDDQPGLSLKQAHRKLSALGAKVQLIPGDPFAALARMANSLSGTDLVVISADQDQDSVERALFYLPRMLHDGSVVYRSHEQVDGQDQFEEVPRDEIEQHTHRRRAA